MIELLGDLIRLGLLLALWVIGLWIAGAFVTAWAAREKGREPVAWFVLAFFLSPLMALAALGVVPRRRSGRAGAVRRAQALSQLPRRLTVTTSG